MTSHLNNVMSVVSHGRNEMAAVHLAKTYCVPSVVYGCENWFFLCMFS